jgi:hypothetical protein
MKFRNMKFKYRQFRDRQNNYGLQLVVGNAVKPGTSGKPETSGTSAAGEQEAQAVDSLPAAPEKVLRPRKLRIAKLHRLEGRLAAARKPPQERIQPRVREPGRVLLSIQTWDGRNILSLCYP